MTTIDDIYAALNPMPAMLAAKGKACPEVKFQVEANAGASINMSWRKAYSHNDWDRDYKCFLAEDFAEAIEKAALFINELPSADQAKLHHFMGQLGKLIDAGKSDGIKVDYLNPLLETMKRLSENVITHQPKKGRRRSPQESAP